MILFRINISINRWFIVYDCGDKRTNIKDSIIECFKDIERGIAIDYNGREYISKYEIDFETRDELINLIPEEFL